MTVADEFTIKISRNLVEGIYKTDVIGYAEPDFSPLRLATIKALEELLLEDMLNDEELLSDTEVSALPRKQITRPKHLRVLGRNLYAVLFSKPRPDLGKNLEESLYNRLEVVETKNERLRLRLNFNKARLPEADWVSLPWEFLYSEDRSEFLSTDFNLVLSRYYDPGEYREVCQPSDGPLRLLIAVSRPPLSRPVKSKEVLAYIQEMEPGTPSTLQPEIPKVNIKVLPLKQPDSNDLKDALKDFKPHVFHFIGHGKYDPKEKTGSLELVSDTGKSEEITSNQLLRLFRSAGCYPRLVFLHMCEGGISERDATTRQAFSGFAPSLLHARIPTVVAMQYPIKNDPARDFSLAFYQALASGSSVDEAVQEGRRNMDFKRSSLVFGTPVLFMHSADGLVQIPGKGVKLAEDGVEQVDDDQVRLTPSSTQEQPSLADSSLVRKIIKVGLDATKKSLEGDDAIHMRMNLIKLEGELSDKPSIDIANMLTQRWEDETDNQKREIWLDMIEHISKVLGS